MKSVWLSFIGGTGAVASYLFGGIDHTVITLVIFMMIDYVTGLTTAVVFHKSPKTANGGAESKAGFKGLCRKGVILLFVVIANLLDKQLGMSVIRDGVCFAFMANELLSITENAGLMGIPVPSFISNGIELLKNKGNKK